MLELFITTVKNGLLTATTSLQGLLFSLLGIDLEKKFLLLIVVGLGASVVILIMAGIVLLAQAVPSLPARAPRQPKAPKARKPKPAKKPKAAKPAKTPKPAKPKGPGLLTRIKGMMPKRKPKALGPSPSMAIGRKRGDAVAVDAVTLASIETEMLAVKELYVAGHITADVYVSETRNLYEKARDLT